MTSVFVVFLMNQSGKTEKKKSVVFDNNPVLKSLLSILNKRESRIEPLGTQGFTATYLEACLFKTFL